MGPTLRLSAPWGVGPRRFCASKSETVRKAAGIDASVEQAAIADSAQMAPGVDEARGLKASSSSAPELMSAGGEASSVVEATSATLRVHPEMLAIIISRNVDNYNFQKC